MTHASSKMKTIGEASAAHTKLVAQAKRTASTKTPSMPNTIHPLAKPGSKWPTMKTSSTPNGIHPLAKPGSKWPTLAPASTHAKQTTAPEVVNEPLDRAEQMMKLHTRYAQLKEQNAKKFSQKRQDEMTALSAQYSK